jgi:hypothetical protein
MLLVLTSSSALALGTISMSSTPTPDSVIVEVTVNDDGSAASCLWLAIVRNGVDVFYFERDLGNSMMVSYTDTDVEPSTEYCYTMALRQFPGVACFTNDPCDAFDCFCQIQTCANPGPDPIFIGHGYLSEFYPGGASIDHNETQALLYPCDSPGTFIDLHTIPADALQYLDSGTAVTVSGNHWCCWAQCVWLLAAETVAPQPCIVPTEKTTWGRVKTMYRE